VADPTIAAGGIIHPPVFRLRFPPLYPLSSFLVSVGKKENGKMTSGTGSGVSVGWM